MIAQQPGDKGFWDGTETVTYEIIVRDAANKSAVHGALVTLLIDRATGTTRKPGYTDPSTKTFGGTATLKGIFPAGGTFVIGEEGSSSGVLVRKSVIRCEAKGYKRQEISLAPELHFKPKEPRTVKITISLEPE